ncbi:MAG TPA: ATP-dependent Clp protease adaptor ClpS [Rubricoccaceae bacterium]
MLCPAAHARRLLFDGPLLNGPDLPALPALDEEVAVEERVQTPWRVILYDDDIHTFDDVIGQLMKAVGCSAEEGARHAWTVHTEGKDCVYTGDFFDCMRVQGVLREIALVTEIEG